MSLDRILAFVSEIGLTVHRRPLPTTTFLPGIPIERGALVIDPASLTHPGDILHEAGHIAVVPPSERSNLTDNLQTGPGEEMAAIGWSYAAALHIGPDPAEVFHSDGYKVVRPASLRILPPAATSVCRCCNGTGSPVSETMAPVRRFTRACPLGFAPNPPC